MDEITEINNIIASAVNDSSRTTVIISCAVFVIYTVIVKVVEIYKERAKSQPMSKLADAVNKIGDLVAQLNKRFDKTLGAIERKETHRISNVIAVAFDSFRCEILASCIDIIAYNSLSENETAIRQNLYTCVNTAYYKMYSTLSAYEHNDNNISTKLKQELIKEIADSCCEIIFTKQDNTSKIRALNQKLKYICDDNTIYLNNIIFNS